MPFKNEKGFTLIEIMIAVIIIAILAGVSVPTFLIFKDRSKESATKTAMSAIAKGFESYRSEYDCYPEGFGSDTITSYLENYKTKDEWQRDYLYSSDENFENYSFTSFGIDGKEGTDDIVFENGIMTSSGKYGSNSQQNTTSTTPASSTSTTSAPATTILLTPLGNTFTEITDAMIKLTQDYYNKTGKWPRSWGDYAFTDLGLNPEDWQKANEHIFYSTGGNRLMVKPEEGYSLQFIDANTGKTSTLSYKLKWNLVYSMVDKQWYFHDAQKGNEITVTELKVFKE